MTINGKVWPDGLNEKYTRDEFIERFKSVGNAASLNNAYDQMVNSSGKEKKAKPEMKK